MKDCGHISGFIVLVLSFLSTGAFSQQPMVVRGPYLQQPSPNSIIIHWRTDSVTDSKVFYGNDLNDLSLSAVNSKDTTEHIVKLTSLSPFTKYFYSIGTMLQVLGGPDSMQYFVTSPLPGSDQSIRLWAIGDFGKGSQSQKTVRDSYLQFTGGTHTDLWLWLGDNSYPDGTDEDFQYKVFDSITGYYRLFKYMPFMPTPGNHDYNSICPIPCLQDPQKHKGPYYDIVDVPTEGEAGGVPSHTELYYSFDYGNIHFISLNSEIGSPNRPYDYIGAYNSHFVTSPLVEWLKADLAATDKTWKIAFWHQCPYSGQDVNSDDFWEIYIHAMRDNINPILESYGVDLVLTGHDHDYQRTYLIHGLYGGSGTFDSATNIIDGGSGNEATDGPYIKYTNGPKAGIGTVYVVEGNSGAGNPDGPIRHPELYGGDACPTCIGSFVVDVNGNRLDGKYLKGSGEIGDQFTILKEEVPTGITNHNSWEQMLKVFPNPYSHVPLLEFYANSNELYHIALINPIGQVIWTEDYRSDVSGKQFIQIPTEGISSGTYLLEVSGDQNSGHLSVIKL